VDTLPQFFHASRSFPPHRRAKVRCCKSGAGVSLRYARAAVKILRDTSGWKLLAIIAAMVAGIWAWLDISLSMLPQPESTRVIGPHPQASATPDIYGAQLVAHRKTR